MVARRATDGAGRPGYRLSGEKFFVTSAGAAHFFLVNTAVEDPSPGKAMNLFVLAPEEIRSVTVREVWDAMGMRGNFAGSLVGRIPLDMIKRNAALIAGASSASPEASGARIRWI